MQITSQTLAKILKGSLVGSPNIPVKTFSIDSRTIKQGEVFIPLKGQKFDAHNFIPDAFKKGAVGVISEREVDVPPGKFLIKVRSTLESLREIAKFKRENFKGKVIGVAGSAGKTTTKELLSHLLSIKGKVYKSPGNLNSQVGLPLAVANASLETDFWVLEHGASKRGEIKNLIEITKPHVRLITTLGEEHLEGFGSLEGVIWGNAEMFCRISDNFYAVIPGKFLDTLFFLPKKISFGERGELQAQNVEVSEKGVSFEVEGEKFFISVPSLGLVENILACFCVLKVLGFTLKEFKEALKEFSPVEGRMKVFNLKNFILIDDTYNANPVSLRNAIKSVGAFKRDKVFILGDMLELGEHSKELHEEVGRLLNTVKGIRLAIFYGDEMKYAYDSFNKSKKFYAKTKEEMLQFIEENLKEFEGCAVLIKGSRGMKLEEVVDFLRGMSNAT
ncbi:UDP-N-acetylmuramoyl-tripeptide--D-alanyl-D-alanine ligase [Aquifex aeolicus]|uniref:UDP-N-acetylmuramoyl-tripeptide--D-alanyl-D-alanine ligase n=1 Tax=Aquifex aeolicus (strain VF5) TaxID=224324 RepID=O67002_AQUAE|nr:UDP-N-acetylmuramoyl-tripeptide--D-alanyl-D-alanine ligase [Aquifex aeolicus]AAC06961.1 UDP-MURNAC-pentapeptide sythetase [Aquifex aeolicus VF5]